MRNVYILLSLLMVASLLVGCVQAGNVRPTYGANERPRHGTYDVGNRVECNWKSGGKYYPGRVHAADGNRLNIRYDDGDKEYTNASKCRPLKDAHDRDDEHDQEHEHHGDHADSDSMDAGSRVECRWKNGRTWYPGVIVERRGRQVSIKYNDGDRENTTLSNCRPR